MPVTDVTDQFYSAEDAEALNGYGWQLLCGNGASPEAFEAVALVKEITPGAMETADIKRTHLRSPDAHHEHGPGLRDSGPFEFMGKWSPTNRSQSNTGGGTGAFQTGGLIAMWRARTTHNWILRANNGSPAFEWPFRGYVSKFQPSKIGAEDDVDFTGAITPTQAYDASLP